MYIYVYIIRVCVCECECVSLYTVAQFKPLKADVDLSMASNCNFNCCFSVFKGNNRDLKCRFITDLFLIVTLYFIS